MNDTLETTTPADAEQVKPAKPSGKAKTSKQPAGSSKTESGAWSAFNDGFAGNAFAAFADDLCRKDMNKQVFDAMLASIQAYSDGLKRVDAVVGESFEAVMAMVRGEAVDADRLLDAMKAARARLTADVAAAEATPPAVKFLNRMAHDNADFLENNIGEPLLRRAMTLGSASSRFIRAFGEDYRQGCCDMLAGRWPGDGDMFEQTAEAGREWLDAMTAFSARQPG